MQDAELAILRARWRMQALQEAAIGNGSGEVLPGADDPVWFAREVLGLDELRSKERQGE